MLLIPAIDLKDGHCVRLKQGDMDQSTTFGEDPAAMARKWLDAGARRLHLVDLNGAFAATDAATAQTAGHFNKYNLDIARIQKLPGDFALYGRYSAQWTSQNLDSSERFGLGGIYGVRAYPLGEGMGDRGWLGQIELRYLAGPYTPFVFYDAGRSDTNARPWDTASSTSRSIAGGGAGVRVDYKQWSIDSTLAWRTRGGPASADTSDRSPRLWFMATYSF